MTDIALNTLVQAANKIIGSKRGSQYKGVSMNGKKYQVITFHQSIRCYVGCFQVEEEAAMISDICSIQNKGLRARTNFFYSKATTLAILL
jgi:hypothetical protein